MKTTHNKLVRDNIPTIIKRANKKCQTRILNDEDYIHYLKLKLLEESNEVNQANDNNKMIEELADVFEVIDALLKTFDISLDVIKNIQSIKAKKNGQFNNKIFLEYVEDNNE